MQRPGLAATHWQALQDAEDDFHQREAENNHAGSMGDSIDLPCRKKESRRRIVAAELLLRIADTQYSPHRDNRSQQVCHQHVDRLECWKSAGQLPPLHQPQ
ncbi:hypothetical protein [Collimonas sp. OK307]|uniref:hypothetical protein n=1 Tax=Collimonas sp. OK307 TaxID=1801620 RepID=UPI0015871F88|nr:hypothetical protein [Collimonas sp. OK307]